MKRKVKENEEREKIMKYEEKEKESIRKVE